MTMLKSEAEHAEIIRLLKGGQREMEMGSRLITNCTETGGNAQGMDFEGRFHGLKAQHSSWNNY